MTEQQVGVGLSACSDLCQTHEGSIHTQLKRKSENYTNGWANEFLNFSLGSCDGNELILAQAHRREMKWANHMCMCARVLTHIHGMIYARHNLLLAEACHTSSIFLFLYCLLFFHPAVLHDVTCMNHMLTCNEDLQQTIDALASYVDLQQFGFK